MGSGDPILQSFKGYMAESLLYVNKLPELHPENRDRRSTRHPDPGLWLRDARQEQ